MRSIRPLRHARFSRNITSSLSLQMLRSDRQVTHYAASGNTLQGIHMKPAPTLFCKAILLLCSAAAWSVLSSNASAENRPALTECVGLKCNDFTTWNVPYVRQSVMITDDQLKLAVLANSLSNHLEKIFSEFST